MDDVTDLLRRGDFGSHCCDQGQRCEGMIYTRENALKVLVLRFGRELVDENAIDESSWKGCLLRFLYIGRCVVTCWRRVWIVFLMSKVIHQ